MTLICVSLCIKYHRSTNEFNWFVNNFTNFFFFFCSLLFKQLEFWIILQILGLSTRTRIFQYSFLFVVWSFPLQLISEGRSQCFLKLILHIRCSIFSLNFNHTYAFFFAKRTRSLLSSCWHNAVHHLLTLSNVFKISQMIFKHSWYRAASNFTAQVRFHFSETMLSFFLQSTKMSV